MPAAVGDTTPTTDGENQQVNNQDYKIFNKVATNPYVNSLWNNAVGYYSYAKDKSPIVKYASQTIENNIDYGVKWVAPKVEPVLQSELYKKYEPLLHKADEFGVNQIDKIEKVTEKITETYSQTKQTIEQKVSNITNDIKATTNALVVVSTNTLEEKIVPPVDNYLKSSLLATPLNITLNITEQICDQFLPKTQDSAPTQSSTTSTIQSQSVGPVIRAGRLSRRIQVETFKKLTNLSLRPLEAREAMKYSIDLIQYAATQIDKSTKIANNYARSQVKQVSQVAIEKQQKTKQRISRLTAESINALKTAIETLSKQVPEPVANRAQETLQAIQQRSVAIYGQFESNKEIRAFAVVAKQSVAKLQEVARSLTTFATQQSDALIHNQIAVSVAQTLNGVVDNLTHFGKAPQNSAIEQSSSKEESKAESVTVGQQESDNSFGSSVEEDEEEEEEVNEEEDHDEDEELNESQDLNQSTEQ